MYNKLNLSIGKIASKERVRPGLSSIAFYGDKTVATDSFRLIEVSAPGEKLAEPVLLNAKTLAKNLKVSAKDSYSLEQIVSRIEVIPTIDNYPDYLKVLEPAFVREGDIKIKVNAKFLSEVLALMADTNKFNMVELSIPVNDRQAICLKTENKSQVVRAMVMPINV